MCKKKMEVAVIVGVFASLFLWSVVNAQETQTIVVDSGYVIAYGKYIAPPYKITLKQGQVIDGFPQDTIWINDILYFPQLRETPPPKIEVKKPEKKDEFLIRMDSLQEVIWDSARKIVRKYTVAETVKVYKDDVNAEFKMTRTHIPRAEVEPARAELKSFLKKYPIAKSWKVSNCGYTVDFEFEYKGKKYGDHHRVTLAAMGHFPKEERARYLRKSYESDLKGLANDLERGGLYFFGCPGDGMTIVPPGSAKERIREIKSIIEKDISDSLKKELLYQKLGKTKHATIGAILTNKESWDKLKLNEMEEK